MFKIISMYTPDTPYEEEIKDLGKSCHQFGLESKFYPIENLKDWVRNTQQKASVIQQALEEFGCDIVWLDADAVILKKLELFEDLAKSNDFHLCIHRAHHLPIGKTSYSWYEYIRRNISNHIKRRKHPKGEIISNSIYLKNCKQTKELVAEWVKLNSIKREWDQRTLQEIIERDNSPYLVKELPKEYARIVPKGSKLESINDGDNYIGQKQASRIYREQIHKY